ncbi:MAG TPA: iron-containing alcohol dehydrogenase, partial [Draconibacterium sp.]|nr:iron-containing alcohol dehydrogenase [Draconibacterium sp.]
MGVIFQFAAPTRIIFENGSFKKLPDLIAELGSIVFIVTGQRTISAIQLSKWLNEINFETEIFSVGTEPTTHDIEKGVRLARKTACNIVVGIGGGSVVDAAKAIAALATNKGCLIDYLEIIGKGRKLENDPLPYIAVPTTAGTGAEVTKNAVIKSEVKKVKVSLRSEKMFPAIAVIDPALTLTMPPELTAFTGVDALTHLLETFVSCQSNQFIDMLCREGMKRISSTLETAFFNGENLQARENMAMASMLGGLALANVKLGAVHGFAGPMGGMFTIPHGAVCACLLPAVMEINIRVIKENNRGTELVKYDEVARILTQNENSIAEDGVVWVKEMVKKLKIPSLSYFHLSNNSF